MQSNRQNMRAFTVVELLVVIIVIAILATLSVVAYNGIQTSAREKALLSDMQAVESELAHYSFNNAGKYSSVLDWDSSAGQNSNIQFTPTEGNTIVVAVTQDSYCIKAFNPQTSSSTIEEARMIESEEGACSAPTGPLDTPIIAGFSVNELETVCSAVANAPAGYNVINSTATYAVVNGTAGNDIIYWASGMGNTDAGTGDDIICYGDVTGNFNGNEGNDVIRIVNGMSNIHGNEGNDVLISVSHTGNLFGDDGDDQLFATQGLSNASGGNGTDSLYIEGGLTVPRTGIEILL